VAVLYYRYYCPFKHFSAYQSVLSTSLYSKDEVAKLMSSYTAVPAGSKN
jgi:hypothetical protein